MQDDVRTSSPNLDQQLLLALLAQQMGQPISTRDVLRTIREADPALPQSDGEIVDKIVHLASGWTMTVEFDHAA